MKFSFELQKMPTTAQQKGVSYKNGNPVFYNRKGTQNYELQSALKKAAPKQPFPKGTPLILDVVFTYAIKQKKLWGKHKQTRPDLDNLMKNLQDYMTKFGYYADDSQIVVLCARKFYGNKNKIEIEIKELE
ncbi:RusA family crossover junction endodeoxyribonuclease [Lactococcus petauri]|uniref:RusA family crossover junction endodeoxyribonuclease n=1 Tax=Lactococcus petauri TaxID=1940789 RepID=UPI001BCB7E2D|nr:RusA family crossover junction endodeoxyribonuclease [Lactococcus petauri]MBS4460503.1 RusA family crossover junction endodeoxyribonuclease [Lactococcus petauri]